MPLVDSQPFIGIDAFNKATDKYIPFPTPSDAMLASLQLFHDVPCRIMDLVMSVVTHPDFNSKLVTLKGSTDVIKIAEEARLRDRKAVMHRRSLNAAGYMRQSKIPQFVLDCVLDVIKASREARIKKIFGKGITPCGLFRETIKENDTLSNMALVHRSWTSPAQKALGQMICIREEVNDLHFLSKPGMGAIFGPWTTVAAIGLLSYDDDDCAGDVPIDRTYLQYRDLGHFENLHRLLLTFTNLRRLYVRSYAPLLTMWSNGTVEAIMRQNRCLTELTLEAMDWNRLRLRLRYSYNLDFLGKDFSQKLRKLSIKGGTFSQEFRGSAIQTMALPHLRSFTMGDTPDAWENDSATLETFFHILSAHPNPNFNSLSFDLIDPLVLDNLEETFTPRQFANICEHLRNSSIYFKEKNGTRWIEWLVTHCPNLKDLQLHSYNSAPVILPPLPATAKKLQLHFCANGSLTLPPLPASLEVFEGVFRLETELENLLSCKDPLLKLACSSDRPALKAVTMSVPPGRKFRPYVQLQEDTGKLLDNFVNEMSAVCAGKGIEIKVVEYEFI